MLDKTLLPAVKNCKDRLTPPDQIAQEVDIPGDMVHVPLAKNRFYDVKRPPEQSSTLKPGYRYDRLDPGGKNTTDCIKHLLYAETAFMPFPVEIDYLQPPAPFLLWIRTTRQDQIKSGDRSKSIENARGRFRNPPPGNYLERSLALHPQSFATKRYRLPEACRKTIN